MNFQFFFHLHSLRLGRVTCSNSEILLKLHIILYISQDSSYEGSAHIKTTPYTEQHRIETRKAVDYD
jgi:hypothetical protein